MAPRRALRAAPHPRARAHPPTPHAHTPADFKNVSIVGHYIKERTRNAQFVIISLRNNMFELADRLVGIYKTDNATKSGEGGRRGGGGGGGRGGGGGGGC